MNSPLYSYSDNPLYKDRAISNPYWSKILFNSRPIQSSELIEVQTIQQRSLHRSLSAFISNGSVISGLNPLLRDRGTSIDLEITAGLFYVEGFAIAINGKTFSITKEGTHRVYVEPYEVIITENEDPSLRDTNTGGELYGMEGAARLEWRANLLLNQETNFPLIHIEDGVLIQSTDPYRDKDLYERFGNFISEGYKVSAYVREDSITQEENNLDTSELHELEADERRQRSILNSLKKEQDYLFSLSHPSNEDMRRREDLNQVISDQEQRVNDLVRSIIELRASFFIQSNKEIVETFNKEFVIEPGLAYVDGYRVEKDNATSIQYNHSLTQIHKESRPFIYHKNYLFNKRSIGYGTSIKDMVQCLKYGFTLHINFSNLLWANESITIRTSFSFDRNSPVTSLPDLAEELVALLSSTETIGDKEVYLSNRGLNPYLLRTIIQENLRFKLLDNISILFESLSNSRSISIETTVSSQLITFDKKNTLINHQQAQQRVYYLDEDLAEVKKVIAVQRLSSYPISKGPSDFISDRLPTDSVLSITSIKQEGIEYVEGRDYFLDKDGSVRWATSGDVIKPEYGTTYYITYLYMKEIENYQVVNNNSIFFSSDQPEDSSTFFVTYSYYKPLTLLLSLSKDGRFDLSETKGELDLAIATLTSNSVQIKNLVNRRWTSEDIEKLKQEIIYNRQSINLLSKQVEFGEDYSRIIDSDVDISRSTFSINSSTQAIAPSLIKKDLPINSDPITASNYLSIRYRDRKETTNYLETPYFNRSNGSLSIYPSVLFLNSESTQALSKKDINNIFVEEQVDNYLKSNKDQILYEVENGRSTISNTKADITISLKAIALPSNSRNYYIEVDGVRVNPNQYILESNTQLNSIGLLSTDTSGCINISLSLSTVVGLHRVLITNGSNSASTFFSVLDTKAISDYVSSNNNWDLPIGFNSALPITFPGNRGTELLPAVIQEFKVERDIDLISIDIDLPDPELFHAVLGVVQSNGPSPNFLNDLYYSSNGRFISSYPIHLSKDSTFYIGLIPIKEGLEIPINVREERSLINSYVDERDDLYPIRFSDGYSSYTKDGITLPFSINRCQYTSQSSITIFDSDIPTSTKSFSLNIRSHQLPNTSISYFYKKDRNNLIPIQPFQQNHLDTPVSNLELVALLKGTQDVSPYLFTGEASITLLSSSKQIKIISNPIYLNHEYSGLELRIEHIDGPISTSISNGTHKINGVLRKRLIKGGLTISYFMFELTNSSNSITYEVVADREIRSIEVLNYAEEL